MTTREYILGRDNLVCLFVLLDARIVPQASDLQFMELLGNNGLPFARVFTKCDKLSRTGLEKSVCHYDDVMLRNWESLPVTFMTSSVKKQGREDLLGFIEESINNFSNSD
jgi:GTP-binding protein